MNSLFLKVKWFILICSESNRKKNLAHLRSFVRSIDISLDSFIEVKIESKGCMCVQFIVSRLCIWKDKSVWQDSYIFDEWITGSIFTSMWKQELKYDEYVY